MSTERLVRTPQGDARLVAQRAKRPLAHLVLTHGAGGGIDAPDLQALLKALPHNDISVTLAEMPWRVAGKKLAPRPALIDQAYLACLNGMRDRAPLVLGGRSAGARSACRLAREAAATGVLALAFPLHPPGKPENSRLDELEGAGVRTLVVQGEKDPFGTPSEFPEDVDLTPVPAADHSFKVAKKAPVSQEEALAIVVEAALEWIPRLVSGNR